jgi:hypothetical protein
MNAPNIDVPMNWNWITGRIAVGSRPCSVDDVQALSAAGITHILNVCNVDDAPIIAPAAWSDLDIEGYLYNPTEDDGQPKSVSWFADSLAFALPLMTGKGTRLMIHCYDGCDRSASTAYAVMRALGLMKDEAGMLLVTHRPVTITRRYDADADAAIKELYGF